jgi:hypothetical protein
MVYGVECHFQQYGPFNLNICVKYICTQNLCDWLKCKNRPILEPLYKNLTF